MKRFKLFEGGNYVSSGENKRSFDKITHVESKIQKVAHEGYYLKYTHAISKGRMLGEQKILE